MGNSARAMTLVDSEFTIGIRFEKRPHSNSKCVLCSVLADRTTGMTYYGVEAASGAVRCILEHYKSELVNSRLYVHCKSVKVDVYMLLPSGELVCVEMHTIDRKKN